MKVIAQFQSSYFKLGCQQRRISKQATTSPLITTAIGDAIHQCVSTNAICCNRLCSDLSINYNNITCNSNFDSCNSCSDSKNIFEMEEIGDDSHSIRSPIIIGTDESIDNISTFSNKKNKNFYKNLNIKKRMLISVPMTLSSMETEPAMKYMKYLQYQTTSLSH